MPIAFQRVFVLLAVMMFVVAACDLGGSDNNTDSSNTDTNDVQLSPTSTPLLDENGNPIDPFDPSVLGDSGAGNTPMTRQVRAVDGLELVDYSEVVIDNVLYASFVIRNARDEDISGGQMVVTLLDADNIPLAVLNFPTSARNIPPDAIMVMQGLTSLDDYPDYDGIAAAAQTLVEVQALEANTYWFDPVEASFDTETSLLSASLENTTDVQLAQSVAHFLLYDSDNNLLGTISASPTGLENNFWPVGGTITYEVDVSNYVQIDAAAIARAELNLFMYHYPAFD